jgi:hypothetical protein
MSLGRYSKTPAERKRYAIDYSEWLDTGETVSSYIFATSPTTASPLVVDATSLATGNEVLVFFVSGGIDGQQYTVDVKATTSGGQVKEDTVLFNVRAAS